jgi:hypothetical protein
MQPYQWIARLGLFGAALICLLCEPIVFFLAGMANDDPTPNPHILLLSQIAVEVPVVLALLFAGAGVWFELHPKLAKYGAALGLVAAMGSVWFAASVL